MTSRRKWLVIVLVSMAAVMLYPFKTTVVPSQRVLVTTKDMRPVKNALVRQKWQNYSLERYGREEDLRTDAHGRITFPTRTIRAPLVWRLLGPLASIAGQGVHSSFGVHSDMFPLVNNDVEVSTEITQRQPDEILHRLEL
jgi:hypothetical protein